MPVKGGNRSFAVTNELIHHIAIIGCGTSSCLGYCYPPLRSTFPQSKSPSTRSSVSAGYLATPPFSSHSL